METQQIRMKPQITSVINYALQQNKLPIVQELIIHNDTTEPISNAVLRITAEPEMILDFEQHIEILPKESATQINCKGLHANGSFLAGLTERIRGIMHVSLHCDGAILAQETREVTALAFDEWHGSTYFPELLTAFVTPNHPEISKINIRASRLLNQWIGDPSLSAYQTKDPDRVLKQAAAIYGAIQEQEIVYSVPPASFEMIGQRVRLCDTIIARKLGTCMDLTLFYAACLEDAGLNPLLLLIEGHIFAGVWLEEMTFSESVQDDPSVITKRLADGVNEIAVIECTALVSGKNMDFDSAMAAAATNLADLSKFECVIDVRRARLSGIRPLPQRVLGADGFVVEKNPESNTKLTTAPATLAEAVQVQEGGEMQATGKLAQWERKLLDLTLRNALLNMRLSRTAVPLLTASLGELEDAIADGSEYGIRPRPAEIAMKSEDVKNFETFSRLGEFQELIHSEFISKRLCSAYGEWELKNTVAQLYRTAKTSLEENGANTLYLVLGLLRWYESPISERPRYAPIVLIPVDIVRKSANKGYVIRARDDEPQMNITLLEMMQQNFGISVSGLDPLPEDAHGVDMRSVFATLRRAVMGQNRWDIIETALVGNFSFSQFVMWNDVRNRSEDLKKNKIVRSLIDGKLSWEPNFMKLNEAKQAENLFFPIPADASQMYAIEAAVKGESFVLHGPPGTGKSQTITAMIANALAQDKTVLFVAEKMAALTVVQTRLAALGLAPFCLELHSNKSKKRDILEQLRKTTEIARLEPSAAYQAKADQNAKLREELDMYVKALHKKRGVGLTIFEMIGEYEENNAAPNSMRFDAAFVSGMDADALAEQESVVDRLIAAAKLVGHPHKHPLRHVGGTLYSQSLRETLPGIISAYEKALGNLSDSSEALASALKWPAPDTQKDLETLFNICRELQKWRPIPRAWAQYTDFSKDMQQIKKLAQHMQKAEVLRGEIEIKWNESFLTQDGNTLLAQWDEASAKWFLPRALGQNALVKRLSPHANAAIAKETIASDLSLLITYQSELSTGQELLETYGDDMQETSEQNDWIQIDSLVETAQKSAKRLEEITGNDDLRKSYAALRIVFPLLDAMENAFSAYQATKDALYTLLDIAPCQKESDWIAAQKEMLHEITAHARELREWMMWNNSCKEAADIGLAPVVQAYEKGLEHTHAMQCYKKGIFAALISAAVDEEAALNTFSGVLFDKKIQQFKKLDEEMEQLARAEIYYRLAAKVPNFANEAAQNSEVGILQRAIKSNGRGISIRRLFQQIPNLLPRICPCMLMSPISVAHYLDSGWTPFDIVVFDEASQMQTCKAVGALARGKSAVIVGDPKQMPPTNFFASNTVDEDNFENEDLESILDDCLVLSMPQTHLLWHYRSRHESLIAFSNSQFYENKLYTFPSVNDRESKVSLVHVDGYFARGKTRQNRKEAEAVVSEMIRRCHDADLSSQSVGIVTFNIPQQNLIDDLLTEACKEDDVLEQWAYQSTEPIFIKNLESVQGDERDVILFSIGYGPDAEGKVSMNFGPLNRDGGWRRLNVAVSRARQEMMVFSALTSDQINLSRTSAEGVGALRAFLAYAEGYELRLGSDCSTQQLSKPQHVGVITSICTALEEKGYHTQRMVGHSECKIDIGVVNPKHSEQYLIGIMLDGAVYESAKSTRDREIGQLSVLQGLGWSIHRVWSMDWWDNSERELENIFSAIHAAEQHVAMKPQAQKAVCVETKVRTQEATQQRVAGAYKVQETLRERMAELYQMADIQHHALSAEEYLLPQSEHAIAKAIDAVLETEAPVLESVLIRRVLQSFGFTRGGNRLQSKTVTVLKRMHPTTTTERGKVVYWSAKQNPETYKGFRASGEANHKRDAKDVPCGELVNTLVATLHNQIGLPRQDLIRETAKLLGYSRLGNLVVNAVSEAIAEAEDKGIIFESESGYITLKTQ